MGIRQSQGRRHFAADSAQGFLAETADGKRGLDRRSDRGLVRGDGTRACAGTGAKPSRRRVDDRRGERASANAALMAQAEKFEADMRGALAELEKKHAFERG